MTRHLYIFCIIFRQMYWIELTSIFAISFIIDNFTTYLVVCKIQQFLLLDGKYLFSLCQPLLLYLLNRSNNYNILKWAISEKRIFVIYHWQWGCWVCLQMSRLGYFQDEMGFSVLNLLAHFSNIFQYIKKKVRQGSVSPTRLFLLSNMKMIATLATGN